MTETGPEAPPRAGIALRILRYPITLLVIEAVAFTFAGGLLERAGLFRGLGLSRPALFMMTVLGSLLFILLWKAARRWLEGERDQEFTWRDAAKELGVGLLVGFVLFSGMTGLVALLGGIDLLGVRTFARTQFWELAALGIASGVFEETLFRGILLRQLEKLIGTWCALAATSALFGGLHMVNPQATWVGAVSIMVEAGILLGAAYLYTRRLWLAAGIHAAWNFTQGWVFSVPISGTGQPIGWLVTRRTGPEWLTGGDFGLEASIAAVLVATTAGAFLLWHADRRGQFVPPCWRARQAPSHTNE